MRETSRLELARISQDDGDGSCMVDLALTVDQDDVHKQGQLN
jgi:hypothetical protein